MLELNGICKRYTTAGFTQTALDHVSLAFRDNEFVAILGPSGSGKTTLLNIVGGLDHFDEGNLIIDGISTDRFRDRDWDAYRNNRIGFVFQSYNLIPHQSILANVELALTLSGVGRSERKRRAKEALERVGLADHINKRPAQLSGGQMQRVAIARALINDPEILLADEPTGALDSHTSTQVMDLLKEVAEDRLVIMVTHNPDLANTYATRIVELSDGRITSDTNPLDPETVVRRAAKPTRRTSMSFFTALGLSFNNLMTKKGRTILTAFAGSIGIIGIAAILSLSNGVNNYIAKTEEETLSSYPLTITKQSSSLASLLTGDRSTGDEEEGNKAPDQPGANEPGNPGQASASAGAISEFDIISDMFATVGSNDLASLKAYFDSGESGIEQYVNAIQYDYGLTPLVFDDDTRDGVTQLSPSALTSVMGPSSSASSSSLISITSSNTSVFYEMLDDPELLASQYDLVAGRWAEAADECVLVLSSKGSLSDYVLYGIGVLDPNELSSMIQGILGAETDKVEVSSSKANLTYDEALDLAFKVISPAEIYRKNTETGGWTDMSEDTDFMTSVVEDGLDLRVVGVVMPNASADASLLSSGIAYTKGLTELLMERSATSEIVQQQLADPDVDVFTGDTFEDLQNEATSGLDLDSLFSIDQDAIANAFSFDASALEATIDLSALNLDTSSIDMGSFDLSSLANLDLNLDLDLSGITSSLDIQSLISGMPSPDFSAILEGLEEDPVLTEDQIEEVMEISGQLVVGFVSWWGENAGNQSIDPDDENFTEEMIAYFQEYLQTEEAQVLLAQIELIAGEPVRERVEQILSDYVANSLAPYLETFLSQMMADMTSALTDQLSSQLTTQVTAAVTQALSSAMESYAAQMSASVAELASSLANMTASMGNIADSFSVDTEAIAAAFSLNMDIDDLTSLISSYANASSLTYENNLETLGYAAIDDPVSIAIYPTDFEAKEAVLDILDAYNDEQEALGNEDGVIVYTDYVGLIMSSVTDIVDMISTVLIAFVSISLVVSSIMIAVITYISVLERKKEIGILRAIGASKGNVSSVFNAETFIEGLISGVLAIAVVMTVSVPVNAFVLDWRGVEDIMSLPWASALILIGISVVLTLVAGIIPSSAASRRDPVEALRSE